MAGHYAAVSRSEKLLISIYIPELKRRSIAASMTLLVPQRTSAA